MNDTWPAPPSPGTTAKSVIAKRKKAPPMRTPSARPSPLPVIYDLEKIKERVKEFERGELIRKLTTHPLDDNVEHLLEDVLMVLKILHGEEVGKEVFRYHENLLSLRDADLERQRREKLIKIKQVKEVDGNTGLISYIWSKAKDKWILPPLKPGGTGPF